MVGDILAGVDGIEFVRFGGEDVVRHKLVQRIVEAYAEHSERAAPELRPPQPRGERSVLSELVLDVEVIGAPRCPTRSSRLCALALASAGIEDGHVAVEFVDAERIAELNAEHRGTRRARPTCCRSRSTTARTPRPARASSATS